MDIALARTFLEIADAGSFAAAAGRLNVTQTTVSARIRSLEQQLGRPLFVRNKAGARLTPAGEQFLRHATTLVQVWERARHQVAVPPGRRAVVSLGGELSLWNPLVLNWLLWMKREAAEVAARATVELAERLLDQVRDGVLDVAVMYAPRVGPGIEVELLLEETLVLVTTAPDGAAADGEGYVYIDWGPQFAAQHEAAFRHLGEPGLYVGLGPLALHYILAAGGAGYFRARVVAPYVERGELHLVPGAPEFSYPAYAVYAKQAREAAVDTALAGLRTVARQHADAAWSV